MRTYELMFILRPDMVEEEQDILGSHSGKSDSGRRWHGEECSADGQAPVGVRRP